LEDHSGGKCKKVLSAYIINGAYNIITFNLYC